MKQWIFLGIKAILFIAFALSLFIVLTLLAHILSAFDRPSPSYTDTIFDDINGFLRMAFWASGFIGYIILLGKAWDKLTPYIEQKLNALLEKSELGVFEKDLFDEDANQYVEITNTENYLQNEFESLRADIKTYHKKIDEMLVNSEQAKVVYMHHNLAELLYAMDGILMHPYVENNPKSFFKTVKFIEFQKWCNRQLNFYEIFIGAGKGDLSLYEADVEYSDNLKSSVWATP